MKSVTWFSMITSACATAFCRDVHALARDLAQVVHRVEEDVVELADLALDVARHREIEHQHRAVLARLQRALDQALADDRQRARRASSRRCRARRAAEARSFSAMARPRKRSARCCARSGVRLANVMRRGCWAAKCVARELDHLARADEEHALLRDRWDRCAAASSTAAEAIDTVAAPISVSERTALRHREGALEELVQDEPQRARPPARCAPPP